MTTTVKTKLRTLPEAYVRRLSEARDLVERHARDVNPSEEVREARQLVDLFGPPEP